MKTYSYVVQSPLGMHARPAGQFVKVSKQYQSVIEIQKENSDASPVNAKRLMAVMGLEIRQGDCVQFQINGDDEEIVMQEIQQICLENL